MADPHEDFQNGDLTIVVEDTTKKKENESESKADAGSSLEKRASSNKRVSFQGDQNGQNGQNGQTDPDEDESPVVRSGHFSQRRMSRLSMRSFRFSCKFEVFFLLQNSTLSTCSMNMLTMLNIVHV